MTTTIDNKLKHHGYIKISESEYGAVFIRTERFGVSEIRIFKTSDDVLVESVYTFMAEQRTTQYAISYKVLKLIDRKIRELKKTYGWVVNDTDDNTRSRKADTKQSAY